MYKLIIVDDDVHTSNSLSDFFPWEENGFRVEEKFYDGGSAYQYLTKNTVDLIISDIKMPVMNGIELSKFLWEQKRDEFIIFISGYKDFEYVRKALEYGVEYYCLKPLTYKEIKDKLDKIREKLDAKRKESDHQGNNCASIFNKRIRTIKDYIKANYRDITLESVARHMQMNPCYLSRFFKNETGERISEYITRVKMEEALSFLQSEERKTVYEIGYMVGYTNPVSFAKVFKKNYGVTPTEYRQNFKSIQ